LIIRFRLEEQRIVGEDGEPIRELGVVMSVVHFTFFVMADARDVAEYLSRRDRPRLLRERRTVFLDWCVEVEFAVPDKSHSSNGSHRLGNRACAEEGFGSSRDIVLDIGFAEGFLVLNLPVQCDGDGDSRKLLFSSRPCNDLVDTLRSCERNGLSVRETNGQNDYSEQAQAVAQ
jgi:hypothetical protein